MTPSGNGPTVLRVFPDYGADPVWTDSGEADLPGLPIPARLRDELREWARDWEDLMGFRTARYSIVDESAHERWRQRGLRLAQQLQHDLGSSYRVEYQK